MGFSSKRLRSHGSTHIFWTCAASAWTSLGKPDQGQPGCCALKPRQKSLAPPILHVRARMNLSLEKIDAWFWVDNFSRAVMTCAFGACMSFMRACNRLKSRRTDRNATEVSPQSSKRGWLILQDSKMASSCGRTSCWANTASHRV